MRGLEVKEEEKKKCSHPQLLLLGQKVVVLVTLVQCHQHVLQPVPHAQGELLNLRVQAGLDDCGREERYRRWGRDGRVGGGVRRRELITYCTLEKPLIL